MSNDILTRTVKPNFIDFFVYGVKAGGEEGIILANQLPADAQSLYEATVGAGGQYATFALAFADNKYKLLAVGNVTMTSSHALANDVEINMNGFNIISNNYSFDVNTGTIKITNSSLIQYTLSSFADDFLRNTTKLNCLMTDCNVIIISTSYEGGLSCNGSFKRVVLTTADEQNTGFGSTGGDSFSGSLESCKIIGGAGAYAIICDNECSVIDCILDGNMLSIVIYNAHNLYINNTTTGRGSYFDCYVVNSLGSGHSIIAGNITAGTIGKFDFVTFGGNNVKLTNIITFSTITIGKNNYTLDNVRVNSGNIIISPTANKTVIINSRTLSAISDTGVSSWVDPNSNKLL